MPYWVWGLIGFGAFVAGLAKLWPLRPRRTALSRILQRHLGTSDPQQVVTVERTFPLRLQVDLQKAIEQVVAKETKVVGFYGVEERSVYFAELVQIAEIFMSSGGRGGPKATPPQYEYVSVGDEKPVPVLRNGLWLLKKGRLALALLMVPSYYRRPAAGMSVQLASRDTAEARQIMEQLLAAIRQTFEESRSYRGKVLSLEDDVEDFSGERQHITVLPVPQVRREEVILPEGTLNAIERNVLEFVKHRDSLKSRGFHVKKGLLFYGPPGTGKTHTIRYLISSLQGHTVFVIRAEQMACLSEYVMLARLLQPSLVVIEDVDLIATQRSEERPNLPLLNRLLDEMDGLSEEAEILFILTTNRPLCLEEALAGRPGRIDQAIEFPLPDLGCRCRLIRLYAKGLVLSESLCEEIARRTEGVSAAFIKELMRRAWQCHLENGAGEELTWPDVQRALDEMTVSGGKLNLKLLGAERFGFQS
ncbi:ATP-dependent zinc metalloprotease FtsH 3 [bacterium HR36]|nr:ATP-dependent zinc metalloprotease FtsH 3 [bacterium HR36]